MTDPRYEIWKDRMSGSLWAVELSRGRVVGCYGSLDSGDSERARFGDFPFERDRGVLRTLNTRRDQFVRQNGE